MPELVVQAETYVSKWPEYNVALTFDRFSETASDISASLVVHLLSETRRKIWGPVRVTLTRTSEINQLARTLNNLCQVGDSDWHLVVSQSFSDVAEAFRSRIDVVRLADLDVPDSPPELIPGLLLDHQTTVIAAEASSGKSYLATAIAVSVATGQPLFGDHYAPTEPRPVLYVDWETDTEIQAHRLQRICAGLDIEPPENLWYARCTRNLQAAIRQIKQWTAELGAGLVIIDSIGPAAGGELEKSEVALQAMSCLNELHPAARLVLAHISKSSRDQRASERTPIGSVFFYNIPRSVWVLQRGSAEESDVIECALLNVKSNVGRQRAPIAYRMEFDEPLDGLIPASVKFVLSRIDDSPELVEHASLQTRICALLRDERRPMEAAEIADLLGVKPNLVRAILGRLKSAGRVVRLGAGRDVSWALSAERGGWEMEGVQGEEEGWL